jgi:UDP-glucuronate 4-epimerase
VKTNEERFLITGALGCIGAWVVRNLVQEGVATAVFDLADDAHRLKLIMADEELAQVRFIQGDISDLKAVEAALNESGANRVIHLAAFQVPSCRADPALGARVNVVGTVNLFEAAKRANLARIVYASSLLVYGPGQEYPPGPIAHDAPARPRTHYGVYKQANEGTARIYWLDDGLSSIGLRPYVVYGPGRDQGLTSGPTKAMLAAALDKEYHIPYGGRCDMQFADDVAQTFIRATRIPFEGAAAFNLRGSVVHMREVVAAIEAAQPASRGRISFEDQALPFPEEADDSQLASLLGPPPYTPLGEGVATTLAIFKQALASGRITPEL